MTTTLRRTPSSAATSPAAADDDRAPTMASSSGSDLLDFIQADALASGSSGDRRRGGRNGHGASSSRDFDGGVLRGSVGFDDAVGGGGGSTATGPRRRGGDPFGGVRLTPRRTGRRSLSSPGPGSGDDDCDGDDLDGDEGDEEEDLVGDMPALRSLPSLRGGKKGGGGGGVGVRRSKVVAKRQRMPLGGGYGGMFASADDDDDDRRRRRDGDATTAATGDDRSASVGSASRGSSRGGSTVSSLGVGSVRSAFTLASKLFRGRSGARRRDTGGGDNPYAGRSSGGPSGGRSVGSFASSRLRPDDAPWTRIAAWYLHLPFRFRYFLQLFAIVGVFMLASLNYFIAMEGDVGASGGATTRGGTAPKLKPSTHGVEGRVREGGGASPNVVPKLRVRDPFRFLHRDPRPNGLLDLAVAKFRASGRFGGDDAQRRPQKAGYAGGIDGRSDAGGGYGDPFALGWRSMPRQIHRDFATGLSDDARTIEHSGKGKQDLADAMGRDAEGEGDRRPSRGTIAYVLPVTSCYPDDDGGERSGESSRGAPRTEAAFRDVALLLRATIHARSARNPASESQYDYRMHAFVHPRAKKCRSAAEGDGDAGELFAPRPPGDRGEGTGLLDGREGGIVDRSVVLQNLGYKVAVRYPPLTTKDVRSDVLRKHLEERPGDPLADLIRLYAYELEEYDAVALVDYDTLVLGPVDGAADLIVNGGKGSGGGDGDNGGGGVDAVFSWERVPSFADPQARANVINLSFLLVRPSLSTFPTLVEGYKTAKFSEARGFGSLGRGPHPGWTTSRGYLTYYYDEVAGRGSRMEVGRCAYGHPGDEEDVGEKRTALILSGMRVECGGGGADGAGAVPAGGDDPCATCAASKAEEVIVADLSRCRAPWTCGAEDAAGEGGGDTPATADVLSPGPCQKFRNAWFRGRLQMEDVHPQLEKGRGELCVEGRYRPMKLLKPSVAYKPGFLN